MPSDDFSPVFSISRLVCLAFSAVISVSPRHAVVKVNDCKIVSVCWVLTIITYNLDRHITYSAFPPKFNNQALKQTRQYTSGNRQTTARQLVTCCESNAHKILVFHFFCSIVVLQWAGTCLTSCCEFHWRTFHTVIKPIKVKLTSFDVTNFFPTLHNSNHNESFISGRM